MKKKVVAKLFEYPRHENVNGLKPYVVKELFGQYAVHGVGKLITCNRENAKELGVQFLELHGKVASPNMHEIGDDTWEILECEVIIIPRRKLKSLRTEKDGKPMMSKMTAQQLYLGNDILVKMENSYLIRSDPDTTEYDREKVETVKLTEKA